MRKILLLLCLTPLFLYGQLSDIAQIQKNQHPERYELIKNFAQSKWGEDYDMAVYEINLQVKNMTDMCSVVIHHFYFPKDDFDIKLMLSAIFKWQKAKDNEYNIHNAESVIKRISELTTIIKAENSGSDIGDLKKDYIGRVIDQIAVYKTDWQMVKYEYDNQLKAKQSL